MNKRYFCRCSLATAPSWVGHHNSNKTTMLFNRRSWWCRKSPISVLQELTASVDEAFLSLRRKTGTIRARFSNAKIRAKNYFTRRVTSLSTKCRSTSYQPQPSEASSPPPHNNSRCRSPRIPIFNYFILKLSIHQLHFQTIALGHRALWRCFSSGRLWAMRITKVGLDRITAMSRANSGSCFWGFPPNF